MIKKIIKRILFPDGNRQKIYSGPAAGMYVKFNTNHRMQHLLGLYEREIYPYMKRALPKAHTLIDVGANDGYYVLAFLKTDKKVIACEPGPIVNELIANAELNNFKEGRDFEMETRLVGSTAEPGFISIAEMVKNVERPCFILVDIDGGETDLLHSCGSEFEHEGISWLVETNSAELEKECISF